MRRSLLAASLLIALTTTGCGGDLLFRNDRRITITSPDSFATVSQPLTIRWSARDFTAPADGHFMVFLDRSPQAPGETIDSFAPADRYGIVTLDQTEVTTSSFRRDPNAPSATAAHHEATVIVVDPSGRRIGETAGFVEFDVSS